jgi:hypothetical protein
MNDISTMDATLGRPIVIGESTGSIASSNESLTDRSSAEAPTKPTSIAVIVGHTRRPS